LKYGDENGSVGDYVQPSSKTPDAPFKPAFAAFSYGAYTHGNGMSQYGAKGRADKGVGYKDILKFYYKVGTISPGGFPKTISVQGYGTMDFQKYLYGIAEMPSDWNTNALKAQAIAARTYAYKTGKPICITQACQVFSKSKSDNPPSKWKDAVDSTKGVILDNPKTSQYSSTTGGYINNVGWDVKGDWPGDAYEKMAGSPWFYKAWYTKSYNDGNTCGHPHPWLKSSEMADILNAWVVYTKGTGSEKSHISPLTTSCWGGDPYSPDKMGDTAEKYISNRYTSVSDVNVDISNGGYTSKVTLKTNNGAVSIDGGVFKTVYNLRAPGYVSIKNTLYDFETVN
jgi:peptidoglycan hydrolase-like amidase